MQADAAVWRNLAAAPKNCLLDYDGTLAPFVSHVLRAEPYPGIRECIAGLMQRRDMRVVLVSGRPAQQAASFLGVTPAPEVWGCHGLERLLPGGEIVRFPVEPEQEAGLVHAADWAAYRRLSGYLEHKSGCLAFHVRGLPKPKAAFMLEQASKDWRALADEHRLSLHTFDGGLELRVPGMDKGLAVAAIRRESSPEHVTIYLGDDTTDEDAFAALQPRDIAVLVRAAPRETLAAWWLRPPDEMLAFLNALLRLGEAQVGR